PDRAGSTLYSSVHVACTDNAFWDGERVYYCNGGSYQPLVGAFDVVGHEWAHAITELAPPSRTQLAYERESGALNEAFSDWFGTAVERNYGENNWTMGEGIWIIRDLSSPTLYGQPAYVGGPNWFPLAGCVPDCSPGGNDCCGVHTNSGVPNKMFYLLANGGTFRGISVTGIGVPAAIDIALDANTFYWTTYETFLGARNAMVTVANNNYGAAHAESVRRAWAAVGVGSIASINVSPTTGLITTEGGGAAPFYVSLGSQPTANVTIAFSTSDATEGTVSPASVTFTSSDWSLPKTITVTGVNDPVDDGNIAYTIITGTAVSSDAGYNGVNPADVSVTNNDNDTAGVVVFATPPLQTSEAGGFETFGIQLATQPLANVSLNIISSDTSEGTVSPATLSFTPGDWSTPKIVTVTGVNDALLDGAIAYTVIIGATSSADPLYSGINPPDLSATNADNDLARVRGDFNGDGKPDILLRNYGTGGNTVWFMNGTSYYANASLTSFGINYRLYGTADFNNDGHTDLLLRHTSTGAAQIWLMNGVNFAAAAGLPGMAAAWQFCATGDFNGDNKPDIVLRNYTTGQNQIWLMNGTLYAGSAVLPQVANLNVRFEGVGDFNGDGKNDILMRNYASGQNLVWVMNGVNYQSTLTVTPLANLAWKIQGVADYNGDTKPDIVWHNANTGQNLIWLMNGSNYVSAAGLPQTFNLNWEIAGPR
ncbi:MAG: M4 family metallopeptidase, partial [Thermoanaerobaculia bacterium]